MSYSLKFSLTSYSQYWLFLPFRSIWCFWKQSQMICLTQNKGFKKCISSRLGRPVTPWSSPWPPTVRTGCSCPSGPSESSGNGPKWFAIPKNLVLDTKIKSLCCSEAELLHEELDHLFRIFVRSGFLLPYAYIHIRIFFKFSLFLAGLVDKMAFTFNLLVWFGYICRNYARQNRNQSQMMTIRSRIISGQPVTRKSDGWSV